MLSSVRFCLFYSYDILSVLEASYIVYLFITAIFRYILHLSIEYSSIIGFSESWVAFLMLAIVPKVFTSFI
jgi:hypothetical protein